MSPCDDNIDNCSLGESQDLDGEEEDEFERQWLKRIREESDALAWLRNNKFDEFVDLLNNSPIKIKTMQDLLSLKDN